MFDEEKVKNWVENGKQVGETIQFPVDDTICFGTVGVQKWKGRYKVYVDEILEPNLVSEKYEREEILVFDTVEDVVSFVNTNTRSMFASLRPCRGQKIFNPAFDE